LSRLDLVVGPNGAGKSTFAQLLLAPLRPGSLFVNADVIAAERWPEDSAVHAYEASRIAAETRSALIRDGREFIAETVFSHASKLDLIDEATASGYFVSLHVLVLPEDLAVARVAFRVEQGGHEVPEQKIRERHRRLWTYVVPAVEKASSADFWDNSTIDGPALIAELAGGNLLGRPKWPDWTPPIITERWPKFR
jgi:predicted ABC-type ATPase